MKGFFDISIYYAIAIISLTILTSSHYLDLIPDSCDQIPLEGKYIWLPNSVSEIFEDSIINLHFNTMRGNEISLYGYVSGQKIQNMKCGRSQNYDYEVWMSDLNAIALATSNKPITTFQQLRREGQIKVKANGEENKQRLNDADILETQDDEAVPGSIQNFFKSIRTANILLILTP